MHAGDDQAVTVNPISIPNHGDRWSNLDRMKGNSGSAQVPDEFSFDHCGRRWNWGAVRSVWYTCGHGRKRRQRRRFQYRRVQFLPSYRGWRVVCMIKDDTRGSDKDSQTKRRIAKDDGKSGGSRRDRIGVADGMGRDVLASSPMPRCPGFPRQSGSFQRVLIT